MKKLILVLVLILGSPSVAMAQIYADIAELSDKEYSTAVRHGYELCISTKTQAPDVDLSVPPRITTNVYLALQFKLVRRASLESCQKGREALIEQLKKEQSN